MKAAVGLAMAWTAAFLIVVLFTGGNIASCPELGLVGPPDMDRGAIAERCRARSLAGADVIRANEPWSWLVCWTAGLALIAAIPSMTRHLAGGRRRTL